MNISKDININKSIIYINSYIMCSIENCTKIPLFNYENESKAKYCFNHKLENMMNVKTNKCIQDKCKKKAVYNISNFKKGLYCATHKKENMVNVKSKKCIEQDCNITASYNIKGNKTGLYCKIHKKDNMFHVRHQLCEGIDCNIRALFNVEGSKTGKYCNIHKKDNMINIFSKLCLEPMCKSMPRFNTIGESAIYCAKHAKNDMVNVIDTFCKTLYCETVITNKKYEGYCLRCFVHLYPDMPNSRNYKTKEQSVVDYVKKEFSNINIICDKKIKGGISNRRPDILIDNNEQVIIIEIDENQHREYDCSCENKRLMELSRDLAHRPLVFIRFNPDTYIKINNTKSISCWGLDKRNMFVIKNIKEWNLRLEQLKEQILYWFNNKTNKTIEIIQLFYDQVEARKAAIASGLHDLASNQRLDARSPSEATPHKDTIAIIDGVHVKRH